MYCMLYLDRAWTVDGGWRGKVEVEGSGGWVMMREKEKARKGMR